MNIFSRRGLEDSGVSMRFELRAIGDAGYGPALLWAMRGDVLRGIVGYLPGGLEAARRSPPDTDAEAPAPRSYGNSLAIIDIAGPMGKTADGLAVITSTRDAQRELKAAVDAWDIGAILICIDSPGGTVAGTGELAAAVAEASIVKPLYA